MFLAQCPHCHTIYQTDFSVLGPHGGRVTCGECGQVFNAFDHPYSLDLPEVKEGLTLTTFADDLAAYKPVSVAKESASDASLPATLEVHDGLAAFLQDRSEFEKIPVWEEESAPEITDETAKADTSPVSEVASSDLSFLLIEPDTTADPPAAQQTETASETETDYTEPSFTEIENFIDDGAGINTPPQGSPETEPIISASAEVTSENEPAITTPLASVTENEASVSTLTEAAVIENEPVIADSLETPTENDAIIVASTEPAIEHEPATLASIESIDEKEAPLSDTTITATESSAQVMTQRLSAYETEEIIDDIEDDEDDAIVAFSQQAAKEEASTEPLLAGNLYSSNSASVETEDQVDAEIDDFVNLLKDTQSSVSALSAEKAAETADPLAIPYPDADSTDIANEIVDEAMMNGDDSLSSAEPALIASSATEPATEAATESDHQQPAIENRTAEKESIPPSPAGATEPATAAETSTLIESGAVAIEQAQPKETTETQPPVKKRRFWSALLVIVLVIVLLGQLAYFFRDDLPFDITLLWPMIQDILPVELPW